MHNVHCVAVGQKWIGQMDRYADGCIKEAETALLAAGWRGKWYNEDKYKVAAGGG